MRTTRVLALVAIALCCAAVVSAAEDPSEAEYAGRPSYLGRDGHRYVLQTGLIGDMRTWQDAQSYCDGVSMGGHPSRLSPYRHPAAGDSRDAISALCVSRRKTCWLLEDPTTGGPGERLCPLVTAHNETVYQGCEQIVSFVCRSAFPVVEPTVPVPGPGLAPAPTPTYVPTPAPVPSYGTPTPSTPNPSPSDGGRPHDVPEGPAKQKSYRGLDGRTYTLYFLGAVRTYEEAEDFCAAIGTELSPYNTASLYAGDAAFAVKLLCARTTRTTCWLGEQPVGELCPMLDASGDMHYQNCNQPLAFVCRTRMGQSDNSEPSDDAPTRPSLSPVVEAFRLGSDGRHYTLYSGPLRARRFHRAALDFCTSLGQELSPYDPNPANPAWLGDAAASLDELCGSRDLTCWYLGQSVDGLCNILSGTDKRVYLQGCDQRVSWVCRTREAIAHPSPYVEEVDDTPIPLLPASTTTYLGPRDGRTYQLFHGDAPNRRNFADASAFCASLGGSLCPFSRANPVGDSMRAVRALCGGARTTCWVAERLVSSASGDVSYCPLVSQEVKLQWQGCEQEVNFVCRLPAGRRMMMEME